MQGNALLEIVKILEELYIIMRRYNDNEEGNPCGYFDGAGVSDSRRGGALLALSLLRPWRQRGQLSARGQVRQKPVGNPRVGNAKVSSVTQNVRPRA